MTLGCIYGIDFSGAKDGGDKIWIARGVPKGKVLLIQECSSATKFLKSGRELLPCLAALVGLIKSSQDAVFGFDFPFGLPTPLVEEESWEGFVLGFPKKCQRPEAFRAACRESNGGREMKRRTDSKARTPFSPYNLRLFRQTYYGISKVLFPLVQAGSACILPFQEPLAGKPWVLEVCPASTLKKHDLYKTYKFRKKKDDRPESRSRILKELERLGLLKFTDPQIKQFAIADRHGDALDSVIAALAVFKAIRNRDALIPKDDGYWPREGYVYG